MTVTPITKHFFLEEFHCKDGTPYPEFWIKTRLKPLCEQLEVIRAYFDHRRIKIISAYRTPEHNKKIGGAYNSQHLNGCAVDIVIKGVSAKTLAKGIDFLMREGKITKGGLGLYTKDKHVHYDCRGRIVVWGK